MYWETQTVENLLWFKSTQPKEKTMKNKKMRVGIVGCGMISETYLKNITTQFSNLEVVACCDAQMEKAQKRAEQFGIEARTNEEILSDPTIEMVVILTPAPTHYELIKQGLLAGKHVYTEKTMTIDLEQAKELVALAKEKGLYLGAAPDTFLGAAIQKARELIDSGAIGEVTSFLVYSNRCLDLLTCFYPFLRLPGGGICYDFGVYHLTALVSLLGPMAKISAVVENKKPLRFNTQFNTPDYGKPYHYDNEAQVTAILQTESGITGSFSINGESIVDDLTAFRIYGTKGVLQLPDPNFFGGEVKLIYGENDVRVVENDLPYQGNDRGLGPSEMTNAIWEGRPNRASKEQAIHVLDIIECMMKSSECGAFVDITTTCKQPDPLHK